MQRRRFKVSDQEVSDDNKPPNTESRFRSTWFWAVVIITIIAILLIVVAILVPTLTDRPRVRIERGTIEGSYRMLNGESVSFSFNVRGGRPADVVREINRQLVVGDTRIANMTYNEGSARVTVTLGADMAYLQLNPSTVLRRLGHPSGQLLVGEGALNDVTRISVTGCTVLPRRFTMQGRRRQS